MARSADLWSAAEAELKEQIAKVKRLEDECNAEEKSWQDAESDRQESKAKATWEAAKKHLKTAQEEEAALRRNRRFLLRQLAPPGEV